MTVQARRVQAALYRDRAGLEAAVAILNARPGALDGVRRHPYAEILLVSLITVVTREQSEYLDGEVQWLLEAFGLTMLMSHRYRDGQARNRGLIGKYLGAVLKNEARKALASGSLNITALTALAAECAPGAIADGLAGQCYQRGDTLTRNLLGRDPGRLPSENEWKQIIQTAQAARRAGTDGYMCVLAQLEALGL